MVQLLMSLRQILVQWEGLPPSSASWEDLSSFQERYPSFQLEDKLLLEGGEMLCGANTMLGAQRMWPVSFQVSSLVLDQVESG